MTVMRVTPVVTTLWTSPDAPRPVDAPMVSARPDQRAWLAVLDADTATEESGSGRRGLHGRALTQLHRGEPVVVVGAKGYTWWEVVCPWQPSSTDARGYRGWLPMPHLGAAKGMAAGAVPGPTPTIDGAAALADVFPHPAVTLARRHLGVPYLWGGTSADALDCSGLVHLVWRALGVVVPRDTDDQQGVLPPVAVADVRPGDVYFFTRPGASHAHHVGIVVAPGVMVHAPEEGRGVVEEPLGPERLGALSGAARVPLPSPHRTGRMP
jgi:cell wall-associated NlpC family hydrolase